MTTITMTVEYNGTTYPLHRMAWYQISADGTTTGSLLAVVGSHVIATPDQAKDLLRRDPRHLLRRLRARRRHRLHRLPISLRNHPGHHHRNRGGIMSLHLYPLDFATACTLIEAWTDRAELPGQEAML